jgi:hypothetical protein
MHGQFCSRRRSALSTRTAAPVRFCATLWFAVLAPGSAYAAGGAFVVDDAEIGKPGECKVESWIALASNHDLQAVTQPACVVNLGKPVELTGSFARVRSGDVWQTQIGGKVKMNILPVETGKIGVGLIETPIWDAGNGQYLSNMLFVPLTYQFDDKFRINLNAGWDNDGVGRHDYLYWGAGFEWQFVEPLTLIGEVFGLAGQRTDPLSTTEPRAQLGLRITPQKSFDIDLIYGRNVTGENANWFTLGLNVRF